MAANRHVLAINPLTGELVPAFLIADHFGPGRHAIWFGQMNSPFYGVDDVLWEFV